MSTPAAEATDPRTTPQRLAELAATYPHLGTTIATHPNAYPALRRWIASGGGTSSTVSAFVGIAAQTWGRILVIGSASAALSTLVGTILLGSGGGYHGFDAGLPRGLFVAGIVFISLGLAGGLGVLAATWFGPGPVIASAGLGRQLSLGRIGAFAAAVGSFTAMVAALPIISQWLENA